MSPCGLLHDLAPCSIDGLPVRLCGDGDILWPLQSALYLEAGHARPDQARNAVQRHQILHVSQDSIFSHSCASHRISHTLLHPQLFRNAIYQCCTHIKAIQTARVHVLKCTYLSRSMSSGQGMLKDMSARCWSLTWGLSRYLRSPRSRSSPFTTRP